MVDIIRMWTIYDHPRDFPGAYVARCFEIEPGSVHPTDRVILSAELAPIRERFEGLGLVRIPRQPGDDPVIVEVWI